MATAERPASSRVPGRLTAWAADPRRRAILLLVLASWAVALALAPLAVLEIAAADEVIYVVGARNLLERGTLDTNFYLPHSVIVQGHPHRDVHLPGYVFALVPFVALFGPAHGPVALNLLLLPLLAILVFRLAEDFGLDHSSAFTAGALTLLLPPFPGYLYVAFPELLVAAWMLVTVAVSVRARDFRGAALAGLAFGLGPLFRETLILALPIHAVLLGGRRLFQAFLPAAAVTAAGVLLLFGRNRAALPNQVFPGIFLDALASDRPLARLADALLLATRRNVDRLSEANPFALAEDLLLVSLCLTAILAVAGARRLAGKARRAGLATAGTFGLLVMAVLTAYAVRATGRPLTGVRMGMAWMPLLLIFACALLPRRPPGRWIGALGAAALMIFVDVAHLRDAREWKSDNVRQQGRLADFLVEHLDPHHPDRIVVRSNHAFVYGLRRFPVEVVWPLRSAEELAALEERLPFDFVVVPLAEPMDHVLGAANPRYELLDTGRSGRWRIWRRRY